MGVLYPSPRRYVTLSKRFNFFGFCFFICKIKMLNGIFMRYLSRPEILSFYPSASCEMKMVQLFVAKWRGKLLHMRKGEV